MFGSVQSSILMFGEHYEHLGTNKVIQSVADMGYIKKNYFFQFYLLSIHFCQYLVATKFDIL